MIYRYLERFNHQNTDKWLFGRKPAASDLVLLYHWDSFKKHLNMILDVLEQWRLNR
jgi:hypothetical protein